MLALVVGLGLVISQSAFKSSTVTMSYQYDRNDAIGIGDAANWNDLSSTPQQGCSEGTDLPCIVQFESTEYPDLATFLAAHNDAAEIFSSGKTVSSKLNVNP